MSILVEMDRSRYPADALGDFDATRLDLGSRDSVLGAARAMMWLSQLAYETRHPDKIADPKNGVLPAWHLAQRDLIDNPPGTGLLQRTACAIVAGGRGATVVAFAGTDPVNLNDWVADFNAAPTQAGIQAGFANALDRVWPRISAAIAARPAGERIVICTGHSLGGALAILAAARAMQDPDLRVQPAAVFTFGSPRPGIAQFAAAYPAALAAATFRFVHGTDLVATVGPSELGFRHVGNLIQCASGARFDSPTRTLPPGNDAPQLLESLADSVAVATQRALKGTLFTPVGDGPLADAFGALPQNIRDHIQPSYLAALTPPGASGPVFDETRRQGNHVRGGSTDLGH